METKWLYRLLLFAPLDPPDRIPFLNAWVKANIDPEGGDWFNPAGGWGPPNGASTFAAACFPMKDEHCDLWIALAQSYMAELAKPAEWDAYSTLQRVQWVAGVVNSLYLGLRCFAVGADNTDPNTWPDAAAAGQSMGIVRL